MKNENADRCAFPFQGDGSHALTKRELFAAMAMQGIIACCGDQISHPHTFAPDAVMCADSLLAELAKEADDASAN